MDLVAIRATVGQADGRQAIWHLPHLKQWPEGYPRQNRWSLKPDDKRLTPEQMNQPINHAKNEKRWSWKQNYEHDEWKNLLRMLKESKRQDDYDFDVKRRKQKDAGEYNITDFH